MPALTISAGLPNGRPPRHVGIVAETGRRRSSADLQAAGAEAGRPQCGSLQSQCSGQQQFLAASSLQPPASSLLSLQPAVLRDQPIQFESKLVQDLVVGPGAERLAAAFQVDGLRAAPQPQVGVIRFAGTVHAAPHHGDGDGMVLGVSGHRLDLLRQFDERFVFHARTAGARDDVQLSIGRQRRH